MNVTERILEHLRKGVLPWRRPWGEHFYLPMNAKTKKPYGSINTIILWLADRTSPYWATRKTWEKMGGKVDGNPTLINAFFRSYEVFNLEQVTGCQIHETAAKQSVEDVIAKSGAVIRFQGEKAYYEVNQDFVVCPPKEVFRNQEDFYTTLLHELTHWTGGPQRLNRPFGRYNSKAYAFEELVAELGACFTAAKLRMPLVDMPNHASYIDYWLGILREDNTAILRAATQAQAAMKYLVTLKRRGLCSKLAS